MRSHLLTVRIPIDSVDDPEARKEAKNIINTEFIQNLVKDKGAIIKLQRTEEGKAPAGIIL